MTIGKGLPWGGPCPLGPGGRRVRDDAALADVVSSARRAGMDVPECAVERGDLARTFGGGSPGRVVEGATLVRAPVDVIRVTVDGEHTRWSCAHVVARGAWWRGRIVLIANAQYLRGRDVVPRAHPNDGRLDVLEVATAMTVRDRVRAWRRARTGTHLPHPHLVARQVERTVFEFERPTTLWLDGRRWRVCRRLEVAVEPDAMVVLA